VITFYAAQADRFKQALAPYSVMAATVDSFQGGEKKVVIVSMVRTSGVGFLKDHRRLNVAVTRAQESLVMVGNAGALMLQDSMAPLVQIIATARQSGSVHRGSSVWAELRQTASS
jgi:superfamily I DNA and/or RNA helicase